MKILLCLLLLLPGCFEDFPDRPPKTFEEISQPYLDKYGVVEEEVLYDTENHDFVEWHWWTQGYSVTFVINIKIESLGWYLQDSKKYDPI